MPPFKPNTSFSRIPPKVEACQEVDAKLSYVELGRVSPRSGSPSKAYDTLAPARFAALPRCCSSAGKLIYLVVF